MRAAGNRRGFTLAELLLASTASVLLVGGILSTFIVFSRLFRDGSEQLSLNSRARYGIERVAAAVSAAEALTVQPGGDRLYITIPATTLRSAVNSTHTTINVTWTGMLPPSGAVYVEEEAIAYSGKDSKRLLGCTRGANQTTAAHHANREIVYTRFTYYLDESTIYLNANGSLSPATDEPIMKMVEKKQGTALFQLIPPGSTSFRSDRVLLSVKCYNDTNHNNHRDALEPSIDVAFEVFARNT